MASLALRALRPVAREWKESGVGVRIGLRSDSRGNGDRKRWAAALFLLGCAVLTVALAFSVAFR
jgi:hypothetical protein